MRTTRARIATGLLLIATISAVPALAGDDHQRARALRESGVILPLQTILEKAQAQRRGRVVEVELDEHDSGFVYEVQILSADGVVWEVEIDAVTGAPLEVERRKGK